MQEVQQIVDVAEKAIAQANDLTTLNDIRINILGKKGELTALLKSLGQLSAEEKPKAGQAVNKAKQHLHILITDRISELQEEALKHKLASESIDVTLPARGFENGSLHPVTQARLRIENYFMGLGFSVVEGPEIETDYYNFEALNIPAHHPARAMQDTFYFPDGTLLRTQTSPVQIHEMEKSKPPLRLIAPGRVYRCDSDVTHTPMFHQVEGLMVDEGVSFADLKGILQGFINHYFQSDIALRFRPSYFPFTEPSAEVDIHCVLCDGQGENAGKECRVCKGSGWLEVLGCGMVHPNVLNEVNIDSEQYTGWAFGVGIDRLAMLYYGIDDLRSLFESDIRFLKQF